MIYKRPFVASLQTPASVMGTNGDAMNFNDLLKQAMLRDGVAATVDPLSTAAMARAVTSYERLAGPQGDVPEDGLAFVVGHSLGERVALQRAVIALTDPRARGVETTVVGFLADGCEIEDALRKATAMPETGAPGDDPVVVPFRRSN